MDSTRTCRGRRLCLTLRFTKAERELSAARPFGYGPRKFYESSQLVKGPVDQKEKEKQPDIVADKTEDIKDDKMTKRIYVAVTSDRGLCGGVHSGVSRRIRREMSERKGEGPTNRIVCIGDKSRAMLRREFSDRMLINVKDIGRIAPVFADASAMAAAIAESGYQYDVGEIFYNKYFTPVKYELTVIPFFNKYKIETAPNMNAFDDVDQDQLECYSEWTLAALLYYVLKEGAASEQSARMSAMDNATKNADEMIKKLTLLFNRTRQAVITRELIEIISGAAALE
ncbi:ATP synthase subunit gamma, mitochondrial-like isoform X5 [Leptidea sinapis]|uniref:ATP synthase subunit gamma, mitochondrial-like isoform X5 n=1 Tax=Leptidea sinapis TaxID=189913 RepID=UPI0021C2956D|nr:ATP synthase subunit gamma, mitochondrial-like isoform X5 [Leptidea sinapis]